MHIPSRKRPLYFFLILAAYAAFCFFYLKYVPLVRSFQVALAPALLTCFILTVVRLEWGVLFFIFCFPLINNLPYVFGIFENTPHAPTALVLILVFLLGWLTRGRRPDIRLALSYPFSRPLILFLVIVFVSGVITFIRFSNFFPFRSREIYELIVNINGVRAGGALMSDVFTLLNYLTGPLFFAIILPLLSSANFMKKVLITLSLSTLLALGFSLLQKFYSLSLGNTPLFIRFHQINSTFKDANSFGAFLSCFVPLALGIALSFRKSLRWLSLLLVIFSLFVFPAIGSRSSLAALIVSLITFALLAGASLGMPVKRKFSRVASFLFMIAALFALLFVFQGRSTLAKRVGSGLGLLSEKISLDQFFNRRLYFWKAAGAMVKDYPLTGVGTGAYIIELPNYLQRLALPFKATDSALNYLIQVAAELGLVGLLLIIWVAVEMLKQLVKSWQACPPEKKFLFSGALAGLAAFGVNLGFQTYIGSFEVKSTLWLLIALAFSLGRARELPAGIEKPRQNLMALGLVLSLVYGTVHFWNSTRSLSIERRTAAFEIKQDFGLDRMEKTADGLEFRWSRRRAGLTIKKEDSTLRIPLLASHPDIRENPVRVRFYLVKDFFRRREFLGEIAIREGSWKTYDFSLPKETGPDVFLLFEVSRTWNPLRTLGTQDPRNLGVAIGKIEF